MQAMIALKKLSLKTLVFTAAAYALPASAQLACSFSPSNPSLNFGSVDVLQPGPKQQSLTWTMNCNHVGVSSGQRGKICMHINEGTGALGSGATDFYTPRILKSAAGNYAGFQIFKNSYTAPIWGTNYAIPHYTNKAIQVPMPSGTGQSSGPIAVNLYGQMADFVSPITDGTTTLATVPPGVYTSDFSGANTYFITSLRNIISGYADDDCSPAGTFGSRTGTFPFTVTATVIASCKITVPPNDINFGTQAGTATNLQGSTAVSVQCTRTTPYSIGLSPGNGNTAGAGVMNATSPVGNTDTVPYQLRQAAGMSGAIWGDIAPPSIGANRVEGTGLGSSASNYTIYATVPSANSAAGNYQDKVTMTVHY